MWAELLALLAEGEMDAAPWDQDRERQPGQLSGAADDSSSGAAAGWQLVAKEYSKQEVLRKVIQVCLDPAPSCIASCSCCGWLDVVLLGACLCVVLLCEYCQQGCPSS